MILGNHPDHFFDLRWLSACNKSVAKLLQTSARLSAYEFSLCANFAFLLCAKIILNFCKIISLRVFVSCQFCLSPTRLTSKLGWAAKPAQLQLFKYLQTFQKTFHSIFKHFRTYLKMSPNISGHISKYLQTFQDISPSILCHISKCIQTFVTHFKMSSNFSCHISKNFVTYFKHLWHIDIFKLQTYILGFCDIFQNICKHLRTCILTYCTSGSKSKIFSEFKGVAAKLTWP